jgi:hypothetical protein
MFPLGNKHPPWYIVPAPPTPATFPTSPVAWFASITFFELKGTHTIFPVGESTAPTQRAELAAAIGPIFENEYDTGLNIQTFAEL